MRALLSLFSVMGSVFVGMVFSGMGGEGPTRGGGGGGRAAHKLDMHSLSGPPLAVGLLIAACDMKPAEDSVPEKLELWQQAIMSFRSLQKTKVARTVNASKRLEQNMEHIAAIVSLVSHLCR